MIAAERRQAGLTVVGLEGPRLDAAGAESFRDGMRSIIDGGARVIAADPGDVEFGESSGPGAPVGCMKDLGEGGTVDLRRPGVRVPNVPTLTRMDRVFTVHETQSGRAEPGQSGAGRGGAGPGGARQTGADRGVAEGGHGVRGGAAR